MKAVKKTIALLLAVMLAMGLLSGLHVEAKELSLAKPTIKAKATKNGDAIKITISKNKDAEGYEIYVSSEMDKYSDAQDVSSDYRKVVTVEKDGKKKRTVTLKSFSAGKVKVKVRSYNTKKYGSLIYSDYSKEKSVTLKESANGYKNDYDFSKVKKGDVIKFGTYEQDNDFTNGKEAIEWIVLDKTKNTLLVVSKYVLDSLPYNKKSENVTWETCTLRTWLNENFFMSAFNKTERAFIKTATLENYDNPSSKTNGGEDTKDKVFLLSLVESRNTDYGFDESYSKDDVNRRCAPTDYAIARGIWAADWIKTADGGKTCRWWLRSPGSDSYYAAYISYNGWVDSMGASVKEAASNESYTDFHEVEIFHCEGGVRPALWINLKP